MLNKDSDGINGGARNGKRARARAQSKRGKAHNERLPHPILEGLFQRLGGRAKQERLAWLRRPRLHTAQFEDFWLGKQEIAAAFGASASVDQITKKRAALQAKEVGAVAKKLGWSNERLTSFTQLVVQYRKEPTIENYLRVRHEFPEIEIQVAQFGGIDPLHALESNCMKWGLDIGLIAATLMFDESAVDALSMRVLELLAARSRLPKDGPGHIQKRRDMVSDADVNYLIMTMVEAFDYHEHSVRVPASLVVLIRHQLCGSVPDLHREYLLKERRSNMAFAVAQHLKPGEKLSINRLARMTGLKRATAARWLKEGFSTEVARSLEIDRLTRETGSKVGMGCLTKK
jgi:hypothetical protein